MPERPSSASNVKSSSITIDQIRSMADSLKASHGTFWKIIYGKLPAPKPTLEKRVTRSAAKALLQAQPLK